MKVICIDAKKCHTTGNPVRLKEGETYEVYDSPYDDCYIVVGFEICPVSGLRDCYFKDRFIPLSTIDETELLKERQQELV